MNQTSNYQLSQWDPEDRILRTDFNSDNAKIDAALVGRLGAAELIAETLVTEDFVTSLTVDLTEVDWDQWSFVIVFLSKISIPMSGISMGFAVNGVNLSKTSALSATIQPSVGMRMIIFTPLRGLQQEACAISLPGGALSTSSQPFSDITGVTVGATMTNSIQSGSCMRAYGIR